jgi:hypothetical protein
MQVVRNACQLSFLCMDSLSYVALSNFRGGLLKRHVRTYGLHLQDTIQLRRGHTILASREIM